MRWSWLPRWRHSRCRRCLIRSRRLLFRVGRRVPGFFVYHRLLFLGDLGVGDCSGRHVCVLVGVQLKAGHVSSRTQYTISPRSSLDSRARHGPPHPRRHGTALPGRSRTTWRGGVSQGRSSPAFAHHLPGRLKGIVSVTAGQLQVPGLTRFHSSVPFRAWLVPIHHPRHHP